MDSEARRRACVEFRAKLSRDAGVDLTAAECAVLLDQTFAGEGEEVTLQSNPGRFYVSLGVAITVQTLALVLPDHEKVAWWCFREAAEVHSQPEGMRRLASSLFLGEGVTEDPAQAVVWFQKAADLGDATSKSMLGSFLVDGHAVAGLAKDAARGFSLACEAVE